MGGSSSGPQPAPFFFYVLTPPGTEYMGLCILSATASIILSHYSPKLNAMSLLFLELKGIQSCSTSRKEACPVLKSELKTIQAENVVVQ